MASRVEIIERRRLRVGDREIDLATLVPEGGGTATREIEASGGAAVDESVVLGTPAGVYRFNVTRSQGGPLTVEAKPQAPHAEVTRLRLDGTTLHVEGTFPLEQADDGFLFARRRGDGMEIAAPAALDGDRFTASLDLAELGPTGHQRDVWNLRLQIGPRSLRLGTHLDGVANRGEATEYPAAVVGERRLQPYYTVENNVSIRSSPRPRSGIPPRPSRPTRTPSRGSRAASSGRPRSSCTGSRCGSSPRAPGARSRRTAATCASCCCTRGGWAARCGRR